MARYTIELRNVIQMFGENTVRSWFEDYELSDYLTDEEIATITARGVWSKTKLSQAILDHYYMYEIGFETPALFRHYAKVMMREIMEEKAPLLYSASISYDPLVNVDFTETYNASSNSSTTGQNNSNSSSSNNGSGLTINSDTPQGNINKSDILAGNYATSTSANESSNIINDTTSNTSSGSNSGSESYTKTTRGNSGVSATAQKMIQQYRENIIMINRDIIKDMKTLFMGVY